ncbi:MAG: hypothetical protein GWN87_24940 [Desulfuromonadales bacterium]|nr:hypothetical protein [Desulfuromonadales bacterium]
MTEQFVKLFTAILDSSVWDLDSDTRIVWITLLAMADHNGRVHAAVPGIARRARVTIEKVEEALARFQEPDPYSRSDAHEGRRVAQEGRDWIILNYGEHRRRQQAEAERARKRRWWRENRGKKSALDEKLDGTSKTSDILAKPSEASRSPFPPHTPPIPLYADTDREADRDKKESKKKEKSSASIDWVKVMADFALFWEQWPKKVAKKAAIAAWKTAAREGRLPEIELILASLAAQKRGRQWREGVIPNPATWINGDRWDDEIETTSTAPGPSPGSESAADRQYRQNRDLLTRLAREQQNGSNFASNDATK